MYNQIIIKKFHVLPTQCINVFCTDLRTNSDYFPIQHYLIGFYNRGGMRLLRGTGWVSKYNLRLSETAKGYSLSESQRIFSCGPNYCADDRHHEPDCNVVAQATGCRVGTVEFHRRIEWWLPRRTDPPSRGFVPSVCVCVCVSLSVISCTNNPLHVSG
jgi:hypothetical protein